MFLKIPHKELSPDTLRNLIEEYVTRDGTDYGEKEMLLERRVEHMIHKLESGDVIIVFDDSSTSCELMERGAWQALSRE